MIKRLDRRHVSSHLRGVYIIPALPVQRRLQHAWDSVPFNLAVLVLILSNFFFTVAQAILFTCGQGRICLSRGQRSFSPTNSRRARGGKRVGREGGRKGETEGGREGGRDGRREGECKEGMKEGAMERGRDWVRPIF
jgi:hypothetical protein